MDNPSGTIVFTTVGRPSYGFDVFFLKLDPILTGADHQLTDGVSVNFNAQFVDDGKQSIVFVSERDGSPRIYRTLQGLPRPELLRSAPGSLFHDRPAVKNDQLYFISAHESPPESFMSWSVLYSTPISQDDGSITRLTPIGTSDFSPAVSKTGKFIAVASYGSRPWGGEFRELKTDIVVFEVSSPEKRVVLSERGGWPSWSGDSAVYFHRQAKDGWWSIFKVEFSGSLEFSDFQISATRVTPAGVHCFTPAAMHDSKRIAVATRRRDRKFRHVELFDEDSGTFQPVTEVLNPNFHHYSPFVSPDSCFLGYHRFRGESGQGELTIPNLEPVASPVDGLRLRRLNGSFPTPSPCGRFIAFNHDFDVKGGLKIVKSDGSKRWTVLKDQTAFYNSWSTTERNVIFTSIGPIFGPAIATVQIARITIDLEALNNDSNEISCHVKILTKEDTGNNSFPSCSPDGKSLVIRSGRSGYKNLYIVDAVNGEFNGGIRQLTDGKWVDTMPHWSPAGDLIAFSSNRHSPENSDAFSIYLIKPDGSDLRRVHVAGPEGSKEVDRERINHVCFSRDGKWLLFTANLGGVTAEPVALPNQFQPYGDLYVTRVDGSGLRRLTWNGYENGTPAWQTEDELDMGELALGIEGDRDKLMGDFDEAIWISCDI